MTFEPTQYSGVCYGDTYTNKLARMRKAFPYEEHDIYEYYHIDLKLVVPNLDPAKQSFELLEKGAITSCSKADTDAFWKKRITRPYPATFCIP